MTVDQRVCATYNNIVVTKAMESLEKNISVAGIWVTRGPWRGFQTTTTGPWTVDNEIKTTKFPTLINTIMLRPPMK